MTASVRKMRAEDLPRVLEILAQWNMAPVAPSAQIPHPERSEFLVANALVAELEGRVVGCCSYFVLSDALCETASLAVERGCAGRGIGRALHQARLAAIKRSGARRVITEADRPETVRWYLAHFPYRIAGTHPKRHRFGDPTIDHWSVLELDLDDFTPG